MSATAGGSEDDADDDDNDDADADPDDRAKAKSDEDVCAWCRESEDKTLFLCDGDPCGRCARACFDTVARALACAVRTGRPARFRRF